MIKILTISCFITLMTFSTLLAYTNKDFAGRWNMKSKNGQKDYLVLTENGNARLLYTNGMIDGSFKVKNNTIEFENLINVDKSYQRKKIKEKPLTFLLTNKKDQITITQFAGPTTKTLFLGKWQLKLKKQDIQWIFDKNGQVMALSGKNQVKGTYKVENEFLIIKWQDKKREEKFEITFYEINDYIRLLTEPKETPHFSCTAAPCIFFDVPRQPY